LLINKLELSCDVIYQGRIYCTVGSGGPLSTVRIAFSLERDVRVG